MSEDLRQIVVLLEAARETVEEGGEPRVRVTDQLVLRSVPTRLAQLAVHVTFIRIRRNAHVSLRLTRHVAGSMLGVLLDHVERVQARPLDEGPGMVCDAYFRGVEITTPGEHRVSVYVDGELAHVQRFEVVTTRR